MIGNAVSIRLYTFSRRRKSCAGRLLIGRRLCAKLVLARKERFAGKEFLQH